MPEEPPVIRIDLGDWERVVREEGEIVKVFISRKGLVGFRIRKISG